MKTPITERPLRAFTAALLAISFGSVPLSAASSAQTVASSAQTAYGPRAEVLKRIVATDRAVSQVQSVLFGAWLGDRALLTIAAGDSLSGVQAETAMHIRAGIVETEALTTILVQLADRRPRFLEAPLSRWFPSLRRARNVTLRMLANNRSGYGDYLSDDTFQKRLNENPFQTFSADDLIQIGMKQPMLFKPGNGFQYAHTNAVLLGAALERITKEPIASLIDERISGPLHLAQTRIPSSANIDDPAQHLFYRDRGPYEDSTYWDPSWALFSGTITSTIHDVAVMQRAFGSGALVSKAGLKALLAPTNASTPPQTPQYYYGLGVIVANTWIVQHAQVAGSDVVMAYLPSRDLTIVVSTALSIRSLPLQRGYSLLFLKDAAAYLAPERLLPARFVSS